MPKDYTVLLYYCYTPIEDPIAFKEQHHRYCIKKKLRGRIIIASEGINGTVSGRSAACADYMRDLKKDARFTHMHFKIDVHTQHVFDRLNVRIKKEIVHAGLPQIQPFKKTGQRITASEFQKMKQEKDVILLDVRSNYEHRIGKFKGATTLDIDNFRAFKGHVDALKVHKHKKIITYCTGNVKCEKASAYLLEQGFKKVYQLDGGIIQYGIDTDGKDFEGKCYVFDHRITVNINKKEDTNTTIGQCYICHRPSDRMINCANPMCNIHVPMCLSCGHQQVGACSDACKKSPHKRVYDGTGYYTRKMNGYNPAIGLKRSKHIQAKGGDCLS